MIKLACYALTVSLLIGCGGSDSQEGSIRVIHNSPDAPAVDVLVDNQRVLEGVQYGGISNFQSVETGQRNIKVAPTGTNTAVIDATATIEEDQRLTIVAIDKVAKIKPLVLNSLSAPQVEGEVSVRAVHGAPSAPAVDIYVTAPGADLAAASPVLSNVPFGAASEYLSIPTGDYQVRCTLAGTKTVAIDSGVLSLPKNGIFTLIARDAQGGGAPFSLLIADER